MRIKKILLSTLGEKRYLSLLANTFQRVYRTGWLGKEYEDVYFLKKFIREGDWCLDIGAHLGYFTLELSRLVKDTGKIFAVEPMSKFNKILQRLLDKYRIGNVNVYPVALGGQGEYVEMGIPNVGDMKKFAYARVIESHKGLNYVESERVKNESGDHLFKELPRLDFIKCDVEGLEYSVFTSLLGTLNTHRPIILCEVVGRDNLARLYELLRPLGYKAYAIHQDKWTAIDVQAENAQLSANKYFIPSQREAGLAALLG